MIIGVVARIGPRARRIAALARRNRAIARTGKRIHLRPPALHRFGKTVQQQHQRRARLACDQSVESEGGGGGDPGE